MNRKQLIAIWVGLAVYLLAVMFLCDYSFFDDPAEAVVDTLPLGGLIAVFTAAAIYTVGWIDRHCDPESRGSRMRACAALASLRKLVEKIFVALMLTVIASLAAAAIGVFCRGVVPEVYHRLTRQYTPDSPVNEHKRSLSARAALEGLTETGTEAKAPCSDLPVEIQTIIDEVAAREEPTAGAASTSISLKAEFVLSRLEAEEKAEMPKDLRDNRSTDDHAALDDEQRTKDDAAAEVNLDSASVADASAAAISFFGVTLGEATQSLIDKCAKMGESLDTQTWRYADPNHPGAIWIISGTLDNNTRVAETRVSVFDDRVYRIEAVYKDASLNRYSSVRNALQEKYGLEKAYEGIVTSSISWFSFRINVSGHPVSIRLAMARPEIYRWRFKENAAKQHAETVAPENTELRLLYTDCALNERVVREKERRKLNRLESGISGRWSRGAIETSP